MALPRIELRADASGRGRLCVNGEELPGVQSVTLTVQPGELTRCVVELVGDVDVVTEGLVEVEREHDPEALEGLARLLEGLSPAELERRALASTDLDSTPHAVTRQVLREAAKLLRAGG